MKISVIKICILLSLLMISGKLFAQIGNDDTSDISGYFDDGRISKAKNIIKVNALSVITGDIPVYYERVLTKRLSIEVGFGILLPYYGSELPGNTGVDQVISDPDNGYSIWVHPKYYIWKSPEGSYLGIQYRRRSYNENGFNIIYSDYTINYGFQFIIGSRGIMDINLGLGLRDKKVPNGFLTESWELEKTALVVPFGIRFGILF